MTGPCPTCAGTRTVHLEPAGPGEWWHGPCLDCAGPDFVTAAVAETVSTEPEFKREMLGEWVHSVEWHGTFRGTDSDPRETGWCNQCGREVYDGEGPHRAK